MDLLSEILLDLSFSQLNIADFRLGAPWGIHTDKFTPGFSLIVAEGECWVETGCGHSQRLTEGQVIIYPRGGILRYTSGPKVPTQALNAVWGEEDIRELGERPAIYHQRIWGGNGRQTRIIGFAFELSSATDERLINDFPEAIILEANHSTGRLVEAFSADLLQSPTPGPGEFALRKRVAEGILIGQLTRHILSTEYSSGWIAGLKHPALQHALAAIHTRYKEPWSVGDLAKECGMSRSVFAQRFSRVIGETPIDYLNAWRVKKACELLTETQQSITQIALEVGYSSDHALRRNIKSIRGQTPKGIRNSNTMQKRP